MSCEPTISDESYKFFEDIDRYIEKAKNVESTDSEDEIHSGCTTFSNRWESRLITEGSAKSICGKCIKLYESLDSLNNNLLSDNNYKSDCEFLNYWLNVKLYKNLIDENDCVYMFYGEIESNKDDSTHSLSHCDMYNIKKEELEEMMILYDLHNKRNVIHAIIESANNQYKKLLLKHSTECLNEYRTAASMCKNKNSKFCDLLKSFKTEYETLYPKVKENGFDYNNDFKILSESDNTNIISTSVIGSAVGLIPLFGILYKFTPMGQLLRPNKGKVTDGKRYNVGDMKNISLMDHESEQLMFQQETYNIKYQSV